jgi:hypothetical protein
VNLLEKVATPRFTLFMMAMPFMFLCPVLILIIVTGYPLNVIFNNKTVDNYVEIFESFKYEQEDIIQIGKTVGFLGGFDDKGGKCDLVSAKLIKSNISQANLSQTILEARALVTNDPASVKNYSLVAKNDIKLIPLAPESTEYVDGYFKFDFAKDFGSLPNNLSEGEITYLLYMFSYNIFDSSDSRCVAEPLPAVEPEAVEVAPAN